MKKEIKILLATVLMLNSAGLFLNGPTANVLWAQEEDDEFYDEEEDSQVDNEKAAKKRAEEERKRKAAEEEARRVAIKKRQIKERKKQEAQLKEIDALRESSADSTEYTLTPGSVEMVVELDPNNYGFRGRNHRMTMGAEFDPILRGRGMLNYDFRFFEYLSLGLRAGVDWTDASLYNRFRSQLAKPAPKQFSILGGVSAKWRLTEWFMRSSVYVEPSLMLGHMWQTLVTVNSTHWRLRPGLFGGVESVFDSGLVVNTRLGIEFPFDFGSRNPVVETVEPLIMVGLGFAL